METPNSRKPLMKIPKFFFIRDTKWKVKKKKKLVHEDGDVCYGLTDPVAKVVWLESSLTGKQLENIFWHEYTHAIIAEAGVSQTTNGVPPLAEELICEYMAQAITKSMNIKFKRNRK